MTLEAGEGQGGTQIWRLSSGGIVIPFVSINDSGEFVDLSTETKQDDIVENQIDGTQKTQIVDSAGNVIGSLGNALDVHTKDIHEILVNRYVANFTGVSSNLAVNAAAGDTSITVVSDGAFTVGDYFQIKEGSTEEVNFPQITIKPGSNVLTLDRPLDNSYTTITPATVEIVDVDLANANGTLAAPVSFKIAPPPGVTFHLLRMLLTIQDGTAMDTSRFGGASALVNGLLVKVHKTGWPTFTMTNWKANADIMEDGYDLNFHDKAPASSFGLAARISPYKVGNFVKLIGTNGDWAQVLVQNNLTVLESMEVKIQGHWEI